MHLTFYGVICIIIIIFIIIYSSILWWCTLFPENAENPYSATVVISDIKYGTGYANSKRAAKLEAG